MKLEDVHFDEYLKKSQECSLHNNLLKLYEKLPNQIEEFKNIILYGPCGVGKYTQMLEIVKRYSPSKLKYEKKIGIQYNKVLYHIKMSDIHFEIDLSLLGCNSKILWNEIYNNILDILLTRPNKNCIIVCKYFHEIHNELLDVFYSYMQNLSLEFLNLTDINIKYIFITENISFIPDKIIFSSIVLNVPRPSLNSYSKCLKKKNILDIKEITNIKNLQNDIPYTNYYLNYCNSLVDDILNINDKKIIEIRDKLYDIFIYNLNITKCIWIILNNLLINNHIKDIYINDILIKTYKFLQFYNNNYRPIYHLENYIFYLIDKINEYTKSD